MVPIIALARDYRHERSRTVEGDFPVEANPTLNINAKYANVTVANWDKQTIGVVALLRVYANDERTADRLLAKVRIDISKSGNTVSIANYLSDNGSTNEFNHASYSVNYTINIPRDTKMDIINKYGNVSLPSVNRPLGLELKYGNLRVIDKITAIANLNVKYGNIDLMDASDKLNIIIKYGNVKMGSVEGVSIESSYCNVKAEAIKTLTGYSKYDNYKIGTLGTIELSNSSYGGYVIGTLTNRLTMYALKYSNLKIDNVTSGFSSIIIPESGYTDIKIRIPSGSFDADLYTKYGEAKIYNSVTSDGRLRMSVGSNPTAKVTIDNKYGNIIIFK